MLRSAAIASANRIANRYFMIKPICADARQQWLSNAPSTHSCLQSMLGLAVRVGAQWRGLAPLAILPTMHIYRAQIGKSLGFCRERAARDDL